MTGFFENRVLSNLNEDFMDLFRTQAYPIVYAAVDKSINLQSGKA
jgi:hypothetical protein